MVGELRFNPIVTTLAILIIWTFVAICVKFPDDVPFTKWRMELVNSFTWLYIGSINIWSIFIVVVYFSKYSNLKLGKDTDEPEFNDVTWFVMLFSCGVGVGLFFYGVAEPIYHYIGPNRFTADPTMPDNIIAQNAMNITIFHWGIHSWIVYCVMGLILAHMSYRENLPLTMKSCFYPLMGDRIFGWMGDFIDLMSILATLFGVCTSLGLGYGLFLVSFQLTFTKPL